VLTHDLQTYLNDFTADLMKNWNQTVARALVTSILGQQISWLAARSITHKFIRLYDPTLPERIPDSSEHVERTTSHSFPTPSQVAVTQIAFLRGVGLSGRKAEYVIDLASRFADGRLSAEKLANASDDDLAEMLIQVRGIGMWTVHMFSMFSMRRPDVLPVGDLGVQRGVVRWFLSWHDPQTTSSPVKLIKTKLPKSSEENPVINATLKEITGKAKGCMGTTADEENPFLSGRDKSTLDRQNDVEVNGDTGSMAALSALEESQVLSGIPSLPVPFTPSIKRTLNLGAESGMNATPCPKLPEGLSISILRSRLEGKKIKGAILTPKEMEELTVCWKPYRSLASYYMWALAEQK